MNLLETTPRTAADWLEQCGWERASGGRWTLPAAGDRATVAVRHVTSGWQSWDLRGGATPSATTARVLREHAHLPGPFKFVPRSGSPAVCRADLPLELVESTGELWSVDDQAAPVYPLQTWAQDLTAVATGKALEPAPALHAANLAEALDRAGWSASSVDRVVHVHVSLPGTFRQVAIGPGTRLACELVELDGWADDCRKAALHLALVANTRFRLVRFALADGAKGEVLNAEINLGSARVPGAWLGVALEAIHTAVALTARELSALRDPELAQWALAAARPNA